MNCRLRMVLPSTWLSTCAVKWRIDKIVNGEMMGKATKEAVEAGQAAVTVAGILRAVTVTTISM